MLPSLLPPALLSVALLATTPADAAPSARSSARSAHAAGEAGSKAPEAPGAALQLSLPAPAGTRLYRALSPFGEAVDLRPDVETGLWTAALALPEGAEPGTRWIHVVREDSEGRVAWYRVAWTLDGAAPAGRSSLDLGPALRAELGDSEAKRAAAACVGATNGGGAAEPRGPSSLGASPRITSIF
jgi:hypothetical protein